MVTDDIIRMKLMKTREVTPNAYDEIVELFAEFFADVEIKPSRGDAAGGRRLGNSRYAG